MYKQLALAIFYYCKGYFFIILYSCLLHKPAYVAEVLTMRKIRVLWEHTVRYLKTSCIRQAVFCLECIQVAFLLDNTERLYRINMLLIIGSRISGH